jgi:hypothetical protein
MLKRQKRERSLKVSRLKAIAIAVTFLIVITLPNSCFATNYSYSYWLLDHPDGSNKYRLTVSVTSSLYEYYRSKDHGLNYLDFAKFVTPHTLKPIAESLWSIYNDEEDFANGVLMIVHQIPYVESAPQKYPVETIVENEGDCDLLSFVAASIMMAGGLDVVLLYYDTEKHMNVGVHLPYIPNDARSEVCYFSDNGKRYYIAETTGGNWEKGWRVGECPSELKGTSAHIITLENAEKTSPGQVSSSYRALASSSISLTLSSTYIVQGGTVTVSGQLSPASSNKRVTIYVRTAGSEWSVLGTALTDSEGEFSYPWIPKSAGTYYYIRASWSGDSNYAGADSDILTLLVIPFDWVFILIISLVLASIVTIVAVIALSKRSKPSEEISPNEEVIKAFS